MDNKKKMSALDFFVIGFGAMVGVGWAVSLNNWFRLSGGPVPAGISYLLVLVLLVPVALSYAELVPMLPVAGGGMAFSYKSFGEKVGFVAGWAAYGGFVSIMPWEAIQITDVLSYLIPGVKSGKPLYTIAGSDVYLTTIIIGCAVAILLFMLNMRGLYVRMLAPAGDAGSRVLRIHVEGSGRVTGRKAGTATITARASSGAQDQFTVNVVAELPEGVEYPEELR